MLINILVQPKAHAFVWALILVVGYILHTFHEAVCTLLHYFKELRITPWKRSN